MSDGRDFKYYLSVLKRRYFYLILPFILVFSISFAIALLLPPMFSSSAKILIESQQIPTELVRSTVTSLADERIQVIEQRIMTRNNLLRIVKKFNLFNDQKNKLSQTKIVDLMRKSTLIKHVPLSFRGRGSRKSTIAFTISFEHEKPQVAVNVANEIVTIVLNEDVRARTARASDTTKFLKREAERLEKGLLTIETQIAKYKLSHKEALPESLALRMQRHQDAVKELRNVKRTIITTSESKKFLELEVSQGVGVTGMPAAKLTQLKNELTQKSAVYASGHPEIKRLKRVISAIEKKMSAQADQAKQVAQKTSLTTDKQKNQLSAKVILKLAAYNKRLAALQAEQKTLEATIFGLSKSIGQTPEVERGIKSLGRRYENLKLRFEELIKKQQQAQLGEKLEENKQSEHFVVIEQPVMPQVPIKPNRRKILALGLLLAMAAGIGSTTLAEVMDGSIRTSSDLVEGLNRYPIVSIPYIVTRQEVRINKRRRILTGSAFVILIVSSVLAVHFLYMPLDIVFAKVVSRFSV